jgi:hypothetical protein
VVRWWWPALDHAASTRFEASCEGGDGVGSALGRTLVGGFSDGLESFRVLGFVVLNSKFSRVCVVKGWGCTMLNP